MLLSSNGQVIDAIEVPDNMALFQYYKVLVYVGHGVDRKIVGEEDFKEFPTEEQIMWAVIRNEGSYAEITLIHAPHQMPEECCECCFTDSED